MIRNKLIKSGLVPQNGFRMRGAEPSRLDNLSDAVFGFAITLLVVSLEVPETYQELTASLFNLGGFTISFILLIQIWMYHYYFALRFGMEDRYTIFWSGALLFVVLFYVYPLKFFWSLFIKILLNFIPWFEHQFIEQGVDFNSIITGNDMPNLMVIYGIGAIFIFLIFSLLYQHALSRKTELELNDYEVFETKKMINHHRLMAIPPTLSIIIALSLQHVHLGIASALSGMVYGSYGPLMTIFEKFYKKKFKEQFGKTTVEEFIQQRDETPVT